MLSVQYATNPMDISCWELNLLFRIKIQHILPPICHKLTLLNIKYAFFLLFFFANTWIENISPPRYTYEFSTSLTQTQTQTHALCVCICSVVSSFCFGFLSRSLVYLFLYNILKLDLLNVYLPSSPFLLHTIYQ